LGVIVEDAAERAALLHEAQNLNGNLTAAATATLALRAFSLPATQTCRAYAPQTAHILRG